MTREQRLRYKELSFLESSLTDEQISELKELSILKEIEDAEILEKLSDKKHELRTIFNESIELLHSFYKSHKK